VQTVAGQPPAASADSKRRLAQLMAARLVLMLAVFVIALMLVGAGKRGAELAERGLYGTLTFAFVSSAVCAALLSRVRRPERLAAAQLIADLLAVTAILLFTDGARSLFSFLYLPLTVFAAMQFERRGGYLTALGASLSLAGLFVLDVVGVFGSDARAIAWEWRFAVWGAHTGALLLVAMLASTLARETRVTRDRLATSTSDLRELRSLHERTVESLTSGLLTVDARGLVTSCNPEGARILVRSAGEIVGTALEQLVPGITEVVASGAPGARRSRLELALESGEPRFLGVAASVLRGSDGSPSGHVVIFQDVTRVVSLERALVQRERLAAIGELAAGVAHEVRNPLAAISGCIEMLRTLHRERSGDLEQERLMSIVLREVERLDALISDFLQFARPAAPKLEAVAVGPLLEEVAEMCRAACPVGVRVNVRTPSGNPPAIADPKQLRQVLWNLVRNAMQAVGDRGAIELSAALAPLAPQADDASLRSGTTGGGGMLEIAVADNGPGIEPAALERIFDPFFTTKPNGTGLGLAPVHRIVTAHGGSVEVQSASGMGARFCVRLPAAAGAR
jgi:two-component system, NtrC family, sensor histidine kinase PilS